MAGPGLSIHRVLFLWNSILNETLFYASAKYATEIFSAPFVCVCIAKLICLTHSKRNKPSVCRYNDYSQTFKYERMYIHAYIRTYIHMDVYVYCIPLFVSLTCSSASSYCCCSCTLLVWFKWKWVNQQSNKRTYERLKTNNDLFVVVNFELRLILKIWEINIMQRRSCYYLPSYIRM